MIEPPEFVRRLAPNPLLARNTAFALLCLTFLEATGLLPGDAGESLPARVDAVRGVNDHLLAFFAAPESRGALVEVDADSARDLAAWARAQRLEREEAQVAYELGVLALGVPLPPVLVRSLRELVLKRDTTVAELPNGAGYPTVFLATLHPQWDAGGRSTLFVTSTDARQLAAWAMLLLTRRLEPAAVQVVESGSPRPGDREFDVALSYNPPEGFDGRYLVRARRLVVV